MLGHLDRETLIELAEGRTDEGTSHLACCDACRRQVDEVREVLANIQAVEVPEPSPLYWDHLSARVREQVRFESPAGTWGVWEWTWRLAVPFTAALALVIGIVVWTHHAASPAVAPAQIADVAARVPDSAEAQNEDPSLALLADLAETIDVDDASAAGLAPQSVAIDREVDNLTAAERDELGSILRQELSRPGA